jgi:hypothetical protein
MLTTATVVIAAAVVGRCAYRYFTARRVDGTLTGTIVESEHTFVSGTPHVTRRGEWVYDKRMVSVGPYSSDWAIETTSHYKTTVTTITPIIESYSITSRDACFNGDPLDATSILAVCTPSGAVNTHEATVLYVGGMPTYIGCCDLVTARFWRDTWLWPPLWLWPVGCIIGGAEGLIFSIIANLSYIACYQVKRSVYVCDSMISM